MLKLTQPAVPTSFRSPAFVFALLFTCLGFIPRESAAQFTAVDIGSPAISGTVVPTSGGFDITAGGTNIFGNADQFTFYYQEIAGDFDVNVRIAGLALSDAWAKAGLIARETTNANSRYAGTFATPSIAGVLFQSRTSTNTVMAGQFPVNYPDTWLRLAKAGNVFTGYASVDGRNWSILGSATVTNLVQPMLVGLGLTSANRTQAVRAQYRDYGNVAGGTIAPVKLDVEPLGPSSRRTGLVISEIMYHPRFSNDLEFIELYNSQAISENISNYRLTGSIEYKFPPNTILPAGSFLVVARNPSLLQSTYGISGVLGPWLGDGGDPVTNALPDDTGTIRLRNSAGAVLLDIGYSGNPPWPIAADGAGHSLVLARPSYGENNPQGWAASARIGGTPGTADPVPVDPIGAVMINEFLAHTDPPVEDYVELYNHSNTEVDISGAWLTDDRDTNKFRIPDGTVIAPRGFAVFTETALGFGLSSAGERLYLVNSNATRVIDAIDFSAQATDVASGRYPDGAPLFHELVSKTPGAQNSELLIRDIVINEIMFHPISGDNDDEYVELYNKGSAPVDISKWRFVDGITFTMPAGTIIPTNGYLVVAKNATRLKANYPNLNNANTVGDYNGSLSNGGEHLALGMPDYHVTTNAGVVVTNVVYIIVSEVTYGDGGRWSQWADGGGSSLELVDPWSDNRLPSNWADSDETSKSTNLWVTIEKTAPMAEVLTPATVNDNLHIYLLGEGECLVDDVELRFNGGTNTITNPGFEAGLTGWTPQGSHDQSTVVDIAYSGTRSLYVRAGSRGDPGANKVRSPQLTATAGGVVTARAKARWLRGFPELLLRVHGGGFEVAGRLAVPSNLGTPGARNSRAVANAGPAIFEVIHRPILPAANEPVVVTARVLDPQRVGSVMLQYRSDSVATFSSIAMLDDGTGGDTIAGDGIYSATLAGRPAGILVAFYIQAVDTLGATNLFPQYVFPKPGLVRTFPNDSPSRECLVRWGEVQMPGSFATYHLWVSSSTSNRWYIRDNLNNAPLDGTFVYNNYRVIYNMEPQFAGSSWHRGQMTTGPAGSSRVDFAIVFPNDDELLGATDFVLNNPGNPSGTTVTDRSGQSEQTSYLIFKELGIHYNHRRYIHYFVNGSQRSTSSDVVGNFIFEDSQQPNGDVVAEWFSDDTGGDLYKIEDWFEWDNAALNHNNNDADLQRRMIPGTTNLHFGAYRFMWRKRSVAPSESASDYTSFVDLLNAVTPASDTTPITDLKTIDRLADLEQWMRIFAVQHTIGNWDSYGYRRGKNAYTYKGKDGRFQMMTWDIDFTMGIGGDGAGQQLFETTDPRITAMWQNQTILRAYWRAFRDIVGGPLNNSFIDPILDAKAAAFRANNVNYDPALVNAIKTFVTQRRANLVAQIPNANFVVNTPSSVTASSNLLALTGTAPVQVKTIKVNGTEYIVTWTGVTTWTVRVPLAEGTNDLNITAYDRLGNPMTNFVGAVQAVYNSPTSNPEGSVVINEIMYNPLAPGASFVELFNNSTDAFDLSDWRFSGLSYQFPAGTVLAARQFLLLVKDRVAAFRAYGSNLVVFDQFTGNIDPDGETLTLIKPGATPDEDLIVDRVRYEATAPWSAGANGAGAALQLVDPAQDNARVSNWSDGSGWRFFSYTNTLNAGTNQLFLYLTESADIYIDDLSLVLGAAPGVGENLIRNGDFEGPLLMSEGGPWTFSGPSLSNTVISTSIKHSGAGSLHLVHAIAGPAAYLIQSNIVAQTTNQYTLSFWYFPNPGALTLRVRLNAQYFPTANVRSIYSTPGAANSTLASLPPYPPLWLNEVQPNNIDGIRDASDTPEPWIELYNGGSNTLSLDGLFLADNYSSNLTQWAFPSGATIAPGEFKIVWADGDPEETSATELHTSFRLPLSTGTVALVRMLGADPQIVDYLTYNGVGPNLSYGDYPDGQPFYRTTFYTVTPRATNSARPGVVFINEWLASNQNGEVDPADNDHDDWFELFNPNDFAIDLSGYYLSDTLTNRTQYRIPNGYSIPAHGFLLVWADGETGQNNTNRIDLHANFNLARGGEAIGLFGADGTLVDGVTFGAQTTDVTEGRYPDGSANRYFMTTRTPRSSNIVPGLDNTPPVLTLIPDQTINEGRRLMLRATATDIDVPAQTLTFSLDPGAPAGALIGSDGEFRWTPTEAQGPGSYSIRVRVTDSGSPPRSDTKTFAVTVREVNSAPYFSNTRGKYVKAGDTLSFLTGFDSDLPPNALSFSLDASAPAGMNIHPTSGLLTWAPGDAQAPGAYAVRVHATDNGVPPLSSQHTYQVYVYERTDVVIEADLSREGSNVRLSWRAAPGASYEVDYKDGSSAPWQTHPAGVIIAGGIASLVDSLAPAQRFYRVRQLP
jgi:hypothetical protein